MTARNGRVRRFLLRHCSPTIMERLVDPVLTDIHTEARAAAGRGQRWTSRWILAAGVIALIKALVLYGWTEFRRFPEWPADDRRVLAQTLAYSTVVTAAGVLLLMLPYLVLPAPATAGRARELAPYLVAQAVPIALPVGLFVGLLYGFGARAVSMRPRAAVLCVAVLCSIASFVALAWIVPTSNQAYRVAAWQN